MSEPKPVILTGLRTNAEYHLGNYLGAILPMVELQKKHVGEYQVNMFAPDLHSFTTEIDHSKLYEQTMQNLLVFIAAGMPVDDDNFYMYRQSFIPAHSELTVILNNFTYYGELNRMTQLKEKRKDYENAEWDKASVVAEEIHEDEEDHDTFNAIGKAISGRKVTAGLFDYPVLMAADILLYDAKYVPVGEDQRQHLELTRNLAIRFNNKFGSVFTVPEAWDQQLEFAGRAEGVRIRSLRHPENKMSKSIDDPAGTILLSDSPAEAKEKIMSATTDNESQINWDWDKQPGVTNLLQILQIISGKPRDEVLGQWQGKSSYGELKSAVAEAVSNWLAGFQAELDKVEHKTIEAKLEASEKRMAEVANEQLLKVQTAVGLRPNG